MLSVTNLPTNDTKEFLSKNGVMIPENYDELQTKELARKYILQEGLTYYPDSIIDWIIAYNFKKHKLLIKSYTKEEIDDLSNNDLIILANKLGIYEGKNIKQYIINVLIYLEKLNDENFSEFMQTYRENIRKITSKTMLKYIGEIEEDIIDANICWAVTDNMKELLALDESSRPPEFRSDDPNIIIPFLKNHLLQNQLIIILQDPDSSDHWFALIGQNGLVHLVEHTKHTCNFSETFNIDSLLNQFNDILSGRRPDRFYGVTGHHIFNVWAYDRKPLSKKTVYSYLF